MVTRAIGNAQKQVEGQNFEKREHLLEYDDVCNKQRTAFYDRRREILSTSDDADFPKAMQDVVLDLAAELLDLGIDDLIPDDMSPEDWPLEQLARRVSELFGIDLGQDLQTLRELDIDPMRDSIFDRIEQKYVRKQIELGPDMLSRWAQGMMLQVGDSAWRDHLFSVDHLRDGIALRGYGQRDPLVEYKRESYDLFKAMWAGIQEDMVRAVFLYRHVPAEPRPVAPAPALSYDLGRSDEPRQKKPAKRGPKVGRNAPCPCGSGKKYKKCCGG